MEQHKLVCCGGGIPVPLGEGNFLFRLEERVIQPPADIAHIDGGIVCLHEVERRVRRGVLKHQRIQIIYDREPLVVHGTVDDVPFRIQHHQPIRFKTIVHREIGLVIQAEIQIRIARIVNIVGKVARSFRIHVAQHIHSAGYEHAAVVITAALVLLIDVYALFSAADLLVAGVRVIRHVENGGVYEILFNVIVVYVNADRNGYGRIFGIGHLDRRLAHSLRRDGVAADSHIIRARFHRVEQFRRTFSAPQYSRVA